MIKVVDGVEVTMAPEEEAAFLADQAAMRAQIAANAVPRSVSMRQARLALHGAGLLDDVEALIAQQPTAVQIEWNYATDVHRNRDLVLSLGAALQLSDAQIDALFVQARAIP